MANLKHNNAKFGARSFEKSAVAFVGVPLVDGQDLEGADLAPKCFRDAGFFQL